MCAVKNTETKSSLLLVVVVVVVVCVCVCVRACVRACVCVCVFNLLFLKMDDLVWEATKNTFIRH